MDTPEERKTAEQWLNKCFPTHYVMYNSIPEVMRLFASQEVRFATLESQQEIDRLKVELEVRNDIITFKADEIDSLRNQLMKSSDANIEAAAQIRKLESDLAETDRLYKVMGDLNEEKRLAIEALKAQIVEVRQNWGREVEALKKNGIAASNMIKKSQDERDLEIVRLNGRIAELAVDYKVALKAEYDRIVNLEPKTQV